MKVLLVGSGGREHALAWQLAQSERCDALYCAPGNPGIAECAECVGIPVDDIKALCNFCLDNAVDLVVIGPEVPLVLGLVDALDDLGIRAFGPTKAAARLEGSKAFMKDLCAKYNIPTAAYGRFTALEPALAFIRDKGAPIVVKADGLAAGKGVVVAMTVAEAEEAARDMLAGNSFGHAGAEIVIEEFLDGEELSFFAMADGKHVIPLTSAQDHKRVGDGDTGPNTGGMGAYSPAHMMNDALGRKIEERIILPTMKAMAAEGCPFKGILFAGIMLVKGEPYLLEFNTRFGDPECQTLMMRFDGDLLELLDAAAWGRLSGAEKNFSWRSETALCVVMAAKGYPGSFRRDTVICHIPEADSKPATKVFHAGTGYNPQGELVARGGRVLGVCALGETVADAQEAAYRAVDKIDWAGGFCRRDIGWRAIAADKV
ncbi:MAG: phosphoribosylamine--glycine ligase [Alphaproteobacteria bacterium]|nr:phosphoribosylamine--glycine ligase [Alphaproteobacteria bacterium]